MGVAAEQQASYNIAPVCSLNWCYKQITELLYWKGLFHPTHLSSENAGGQTRPQGCGRKAEPQAKNNNGGKKEWHTNT
jgi:hypothetical protein